MAVVNVPTPTAGEACLDLGVLAGGVVVDDQMDVQLDRHHSMWRGKARNSW